jgi:hypothetical protein
MKSKSHSKAKRSISRYTTTINAERTVDEIRQMLAQAHASAVLIDLDDGRTVAISFRIKTARGIILAFRLPVRTAGVHQILLKSEGIPARLRTNEQAERVGWRNWRDLVQAQLALVEAGMVQLEEVFLPYAQDKEGKTVFERMTQEQFPGLLLADN